MTKYTIKVKYETGNSFNSEILEEEIGLVFDNIDLAKTALSCLETHYNIYKHFNLKDTDLNFDDIK